MLRIGLFCLSALVLVSCSSTPYYSHYGATPDFIWPIKKRDISQHFKVGSKRHLGIDFRGHTNTPIYAAESGHVIYVGREFRGFGRLVIIEHQGDRWASFYAHLNRYKVKEGQMVQKGQLIGLMGRSGNATGTHLHFEIRHNKRAINPLDVLPKTMFLGVR